MNCRDFKKIMLNPNSLVLKFGGTVPAFWSMGKICSLGFLDAN